MKIFLRSMFSPVFTVRFARLVAAVAFSFPAAGVLAEPSVTVTGLDSTRLLTRNRIDLYVTVQDEDGTYIEGLSEQNFLVREGSSSDELSDVPITGVLPRANEAEGVDFLMLVDNSGSMYFNVDGTDRDAPPEERRITIAKEALREFLGEIDNPRDRVGLASYNTFYTSHTEPTGDIEVVDRLIDEIERPESREAYTEMYAALIELAEESRDLTGRRVVVLLSDGDNYPYARFSGEPHPEYGEHIFTHEEAIDALTDEELTVFAVHFGSAAYDEYLERIAEDTGGVFYNARTGAELRDAYKDIRERILQEYRISYRPSMEPAERRYVQVSHGGMQSQTRSYVAGTLFGIPTYVSPVILIVAPLVGLLVWFVLTRLTFRNRRTDANFEVFGAGKTHIFPAGTGKTVLGGGDADVTVIGPTGAASQEATVVHDESRDTYTLSSASPVVVNNRAVTKRDLEPGDVIRLSGTLVVFDKPAGGGQKPEAPDA